MALGPLILIPGIIFVLALLVLMVIVWRHVPQLRLVDPNSSKESKAKGTKRELLRQRLERMGNERARDVKKVAVKPWEQTRDAFRRFAGKLVAMERRYASAQAARGEADPEKIRTLLSDAERALSEEEYDDAEKYLVHAVALAPKNVDAYLLLGELSVARREHAEARESYLFALKLAPKNLEALLALSEIGEEERDLDAAWEYAKKAADVEPEHPKVLDRLVRTALMREDVMAIRDALSRLAEVNPENRNIEKFEIELKNLEEKLAAEDAADKK